MTVKATPRAAGVVVFRRTGRGVYLLILRAYKNWDFPKGLVDAGEDQLTAAKRELKEETGLSSVDFPFGEEFRETLPYSSNKIARYYLGETDEVEIELPVSKELGRPEHHEYRWVSFDEAEDLLPPRLAAVLDWARRTVSGS
jgi:8-oxo-dGTP pyrophosphatase MutT (NUDIX family)